MILLTIYYVTLSILVLTGTFYPFINDFTSFIVFAFSMTAFLILGVCVIIYALIKPSKEKTKSVLLAVGITAILMCGGHGQLRSAGMRLFFNSKVTDLDNFRNNTTQWRHNMSVFTEEYLQNMSNTIDSGTPKEIVDEYKPRLSKINFVGYVDREDYTLFVWRWSGIDNVTGFLFQKENRKLPVLRTNILPGCILVNIHHMKDGWYVFHTT